MSTTKTKQEEIREGAEELISDCVYGLRKAPMSSADIATELFNYLDSVGVVIKVERELPSNPHKVTVDDANKSYPDGIPKGYHILQEAGRNEGYDDALRVMAGYCAVEPLIESKAVPSLEDAGLLDPFTGPR